jgi:hypothetical protein
MVEIPWDVVPFYPVSKIMFEMALAQRGYKADAISYSDISSPFRLEGGEVHWREGTALDPPPAPSLFTGHFNSKWETGKPPFYSWSAEVSEQIKTLAVKIYGDKYTWSASPIELRGSKYRIIGRGPKNELVAVKVPQNKKRRKKH